MQRRKFLQSLAATAAAAAANPRLAFGALPKMKITRIRAYEPPKSAPGFNQIFNQSDVVVTIETDAGITGIGEGGSKDMLSQIRRQIDRPRPAVSSNCSGRT